MRRRIAAVEKSMHRDRHAGLGDDARESGDLVLVRMDPARRQQSHQVSGAAAVL